VIPPSKGVSNSLQLQSLSGAGDNQGVMSNSSGSQDEALSPLARASFAPGALVIVTLGNPKDKFWGMILALTTVGLSISGIELASFDDLAVMVKDGEPFTPSVVFFPMHRMERMELDLPEGSLPSMTQRFHTKTGRHAAEFLRPPGRAEAEGGPA
jgi:hypothetical protein